MSAGPALPRLRHADRALLALLDELRHQRHRLMKGGLLARRSLERCSQALGLSVDPASDDPDPEPAAAFLLRLARAAGLLRDRDGHLRPVREVAGAFFHQPPEDRARLLLRAWLQLDESAPGLEPNGEVPPNRPALLRALQSSLEAGPQPLAQIRRGLDGPASASARLDLRLRELVELGLLLPEPWSRARVAPSEEGAFALGLGGRPRPRATPEPRVLVQPSFQIVAMLGEGELGLLYELGRFALPEGPPPNFSYRMEPRSVARAVLEGLSPASIEALLQRHCPHPLPQNLRHELGQAAEAQRALRIRVGVSLVEVAPPSALDALMPVAELEPGVRRLSDSLLLVPLAERDELQQLLGTNDLRDLDYRRELPPSLRLGPDLELGQAPETSNLRGARLLRSLGSTGPDGQLRLDPERLSAAARELPQGHEGLRQTLAQAFEGGLPPQIEVLLRAAEGRLQAPRLERVSLLLCGSEAEAQALLALPEVQGAVLGSVGPRALRLRDESLQEIERVLQRLRLGSPEPAPRPASPHSPLPQTARFSPPPTSQRCGQEPGDLQAQLRRAIEQGHDLLLRYDPGARRPLEELRVRPLRVSRRGERHFLHARVQGREEERIFSLSFVRALRPLR